MLGNINLREQLLGMKKKYESEFKNVETEKDALKFAKTWDLRVDLIYANKSDYITVNKDNFEEYLNINLEDIEIELDNFYLYIEEIDIKEKYSDYSVSDAIYKISNNKVSVKELQLEKQYKEFSLQYFSFIVEKHLKTLMNIVCMKYELKYPSCDKIKLFLDNDIDQNTFIKACSESC
jgi:hypothetical protein